MICVRFTSSHSPARSGHCILACSALLLGLMAHSGVAQAALTYTAIPANASLPVTQVDLVHVLPFEQAPQNAVADYTSLSALPGLPARVSGGQVTLLNATPKYTMPATWPAAWQNGYTGAIYGSDTNTLTMPPRVTAFYLFASTNTPNTAVTMRIEATDSNAQTTPQTQVSLSTAASAATPDAAPGFGYSTTVWDEYVQSIRFSSTGNGGVPIAVFGIAQVANAPSITRLERDSAGNTRLHFTPPTEPGTHDPIQYELTCRTPGGAISANAATSPSSPISLPAAVALGDSCTIRATSRAGTGLASAAAVVTAAAPVSPASVTAVPALGGWPLGLLAALAAAMGFRRLKRR